MKRPPIEFRTLNGFAISPVQSGPVETGALRIRRVFDVRTPQGETHRCEVEITTSARTRVAELCDSEPPPEHWVWDSICRRALSEHLWRQDRLPDGTVLVFGLTSEQLRSVVSLAGLDPRYAQHQ